MVFLSVFSFSFSMLFCIVAGLMALDLVPRRATGSALALVGISSYLGAAMQSAVSGCLIHSCHSFLPVSLLWLSACVLAFALPLCGWKRLQA